MSKACEVLHHRIGSLPRFTGSYNPEDVPTDGIYFVFEEGEKAHDGNRIVRVGTHTGNGNLRKRINEHLYTPNKDRSVFRKHVGRCLLASRNDPTISQWELDLTSRLSRQRHFTPELKVVLDAIEAEVSDYITKKLSFAVIEVKAGQSRVDLESSLLATVSQCDECNASAKWLGRHHPNRATFGAVGIWNVQSLNGPPMTVSEVEALAV